MTTVLFSEKQPEDSHCQALKVIPIANQIIAPPKLLLSLALIRLSNVSE